MRFGGAHAVVPSFSAHRSVALSVPTGAFTRIPMNSMDYDTTSPAQHDSANGTFICRRAGLYAVSAHTVVLANATGQRILAVRIGGADAAYDKTMGVTSQTVMLQIATQLVLTEGQVVDLALFQDSGVALNVQLLAISPNLRLRWEAPSPLLS